MKKLKNKLIALCMCVCVGFSCLGLSGCADSKTEEELASLKTQVEQLQNENDALKSVEALIVARNIQALPMKMVNILNVGFGSSGSEDVEQGYDISGIENVFNSHKDDDLEIITNNYQPNVIYEELFIDNSTTKTLYASEDNWQACVSVWGDQFTIIEFGLTDNGLFNYVRIINKTIFSNLHIYYELELNFNNEYLTNGQQYGTFKYNYYEYYVKSGTNEIATSNDNKFIQLEGYCMQTNNIGVFGGIIGITEKSSLYNMKAYNANVDEANYSQYLYTNTAEEIQLNESELQAIIESERQLIDLSGYETVVLNSTESK